MACRAEVPRPRDAGSTPQPLNNSTPQLLVCFRTNWSGIKYVRNASKNTARPIRAFKVTAIDNSAIPKIQTKLSPANACPHLGERLPDDTYGLNDGQKRGTALQ